MFEVLTYSGSKCNSYVYFSFYGYRFDPEIITNKLKVKPTSVRIKKDPVPKSTSWKYEINGGEEIDLVTFLNELIDVFEPKIKEINQLKKDLKIESILQFVIDIDINPKSSTPIFSFDKRVVNFLGKTETEVDFDIYKADTIGLLDKNRRIDNNGEVL